MKWNCGPDASEMLVSGPHVETGEGRYPPRTGARYPDYFAAPDYTVASLAELPEVLGGQQLRPRAREPVR